ncbi:hypothetical protein, partial [Roseateles asaccharophilus]|uniref:hypothetical protein n=1 Tax=Roseateles asaccharophilus TaxID=582607 RepID=UPI00286BED2B
LRNRRVAASSLGASHLTERSAAVNMCSLAAYPEPPALRKLGVLRTQRLEARPARAREWLASLLHAARERARLAN